MRDWREMVKRRLGPLGLDARREEEIIRELADHLEDSWDCRGKSGHATDEESPRALGAVDWVVVRREIRRAELEEDGMNYRTKTVWLPGLLTSSLSMGLMWFLMGQDVQLRFPYFGDPALKFFPSWTVALPLIGAAGAFLSRRMGGRLWDCLVAGLFPSAMLGGLFVVLLPLALVLGRSPTAFVLQAFGAAILGWGIIPGAALLAGALPVTLVGRHGCAPPGTQAPAGS